MNLYSRNKFEFHANLVERKNNLTPISWNRKPDRLSFFYINFKPTLIIRLNTNQHAMSKEHELKKKKNAFWRTLTRFLFLFRMICNFLNSVFRPIFCAFLFFFYLSIYACCLSLVNYFSHISCSPIRLSPIVASNLDKYLRKKRKQLHMYSSRKVKILMAKWNESKFP